MKKSISFQYQAQYSVSHEPTFEEKEIWLLLHGYGQLAEFFLRKFQGFDSSDRLFVVPEATNYGYLTGFSGRVGANWMTKHERETAIQNNHNYLDLLMEDLLIRISQKSNCWDSLRERRQQHAGQVDGQAKWINWCYGREDLHRIWL